MSIFNKQQLKSSLAITTTVGCRNNCSYCPQKDFIQAHKKLHGDSTMSFETFAACIKSVPRDICLSFSGFCEPWLNSACTRMILHAQEQNFKIRVNTTLIGMKTEDIRQLKDVPFIKFVVHLPDDQDLTRIRVDETYMQNLAILIQEKPKNLMWKFHRSTSGAGIHPQVLEVLQKHGEKVRYFGLNSRAGKVDSGSEYRVPNHGQILRPCQDFHHNILLPNGDVTLCHMDWSLKHILGNLLTMDYADLHTGKAYRELLESLDRPEADILCRQCEKDNVLRSLPDHLLHQLKKKISGEKDLY
jgi:uncharacterized Fe-S cluster-containing radical SAM superfamily protein